MSDATAGVSSQQPVSALPHTNVSEDGLGYSRHYAQRIRDLGQTSKESWIKRLWNHMFGNKSDSLIENNIGDFYVASDETKDVRQSSYVKKSSSESSSNQNRQETRNVDSKPQTNTREVHFKETVVKQGSREASSTGSREGIHSAPSRGMTTTKSLSSMGELPPQLLNSPYLPNKEKTVYYKPPKPNKDVQVRSRYMNPISKSMSALTSSAITAKYPESPKMKERKPTHPYLSSHQPQPHQATHPYLSNHQEVFRPKVTRDPSIINLEKRAKIAADKAIKSGKVFTCDAPYPVDVFVRYSLRKRGWVEKFGPRVTNLAASSGNKMQTSTRVLQISSDEDFQDICDQTIPKPWEEDQGVFTVMSRFVQRHPTKFIWGGKSVNNLILKSDIIVNHFPKAKYFSSKVLLTTSLKDLAWHNNSDSLSFFPRCYLLNEDDKTDIIEDIQITVCMALLKLVVNMYNPNNEHCLKTTDSQVCNPTTDQSGETEGNTLDETLKSEDSTTFEDNGEEKNELGSKKQDEPDLETDETKGDSNRERENDEGIRINFDSSEGGTDPANSNFVEPDATIDPVDDHDTVEESNCAADIVDDVDDNKDILSKAGQPKVLPDLQATSKEKQGGTIPLKAVDWAIQQCDRFIRCKNHEDIDNRRRGLQGSQWNQLMFWFYRVSQDGATVGLSENKLNECEKILKGIKDIWPQYDIDGMKNIWIVKPGDKSKGIGISFCYNLEEILNHIGNHANQEYIVQKYIERPLLIYKCKFDIRQWFLVTDWLPLTIWFYKISYLRICSQEFSYDSMHESVHLSNVAVQENYLNGKRSEKLPENNFMTSDQFREYLDEVGGGGMWEEKIYPGMKYAVINTLVATQEFTEHRKCAFELYGADFMMSEDYTPWLLEVNSSPGMLPSSIEKAQLCSTVIEDTIKVVLDYRENSGCDTGNFELIYHDTTNPNTRGMDSKLVLDGLRIKKQDLQKYTLIDQKAMKVQKDKEDRAREKQMRKAKEEMESQATRADAGADVDAESEETKHADDENLVVDGGFKSATISPSSERSDDDADVQQTNAEKHYDNANHDTSKNDSYRNSSKDKLAKDKLSSKYTLKSSTVEIYAGRDKQNNVKTVKSASKESQGSPQRKKVEKL